MQVRPNAVGCCVGDANVMEIFARYDCDGWIFATSRLRRLCKDILLRSYEAEYAEQCKGLGCELERGIDAAAFETLYTEHGRDVVADYTLIFPSSKLRERHSAPLARFGVLLSHIYA